MWQVDFVTKCSDNVFLWHDPKQKKKFNQPSSKGITRTNRSPRTRVLQTKNKTILVVI